MEFEERAKRSALLFVGATIVLTFVAANLHITSGDFNKYFLYEESFKWLREAMLASLAIAFVYFAWLGRRNSVARKHATRD